MKNQLGKIILGSVALLSLVGCTQDGVAPIEKASDVNIEEVNKAMEDKGFTVVPSGLTEEEKAQGQPDIDETIGYVNSDGVTVANLMDYDTPETAQSRYDSYISDAKGLTTEEIPNLVEYGKDNDKVDAFVVTSEESKDEEGNVIPATRLSVIHVNDKVLLLPSTDAEDEKAVDEAMAEVGLGLK